MFLDKRKTKGYNKIIATIMDIKEYFKSNFKNTNEIINAAIPIATFKP